jgi:PEP-CTERM motif-containing protein
MRIIFLSTAAVMFSTFVWGETIIIGLPSTGLNLAPFGGTVVSGDAPRYQQAYAAADFASIGSIDITSIDFLGGSGNFTPGTYSLYFSTISAGINTLSDTAFDSNLGANNALFASVNLSGPAPATLTFTGNPFFYNPASGNLLLDIIIAPTGQHAGFPPAVYESSQYATGVFSRYDNFAEGNIGLGLITEFDFTPVPEPSAPALFGLGLSLITFFWRIHQAGITG